MFKLMRISRFQRISLYGLAAILLALLTGCETLPVSPPDASNPIVKVAVLPIHNFTANTDGPVWIRSGISEMVQAKHYLVIPNDQVDRILKENMGVTLGGQLDYTNPATGAPSPSVVGQALYVDGLVYCNLEDFQNTATLVFNRRKVKVKCSLVNVKTNDIVWEQEEEKSAFEINARPEDIPRALFTDIALVRYNPDGSLDSTFAGGKITTAVGNGNDNASDMAIQSDGKIAIAGSNSADFVVVRYWP